MSTLQPKSLSLFLVRIVSELTPLAVAVENGAYVSIGGCSPHIVECREAG